jgi:hypothetical protein
MGADEAIVPLTACEVLHDLAAQDGKNVTVFGRYSYRTTARWIGEEACQMAVVEDPKDAPRPPGNFAIDNVALHRKWAEMRKHTALGKFRFGTPDYDRWAVVFGRVEKRRGDEKGDEKKAAADLVIRGSGVIVFLDPNE